MRCAPVGPGPYRIDVRGSAAKAGVGSVALVVQKFGGTSVGSVDRIRNVARRAIATQRAGNRRGARRQRDERRDEPPARPRARGGEDPGRARDGRDCGDGRAGERRADGDGHPGRRGQGPVAARPSGAGCSRTTRSPRRASRTIECCRITEALDRGEIAVVAGFQGVDDGGQHHDAGARRLGHERGRRGGGHRRRRVRESTPTSTASTRPTRTCAHRPARSTASRTKRCSSSRRSAPRCSRSGAWRSR